MNTCMKNGKHVNRNITTNTARSNVNKLHKYSTNIRFQEYSSDCLRCRIEGKVKKATKSIKFQSLLCEEAVCLKRLSVPRLTVYIVGH